MKKSQGHYSIASAYMTGMTQPPQYLEKISPTAQTI
jgi:hypothetical protein